MEAKLIDGKATAADLRARIQAAATRLIDKHDLQPGLAVVLVGEDPASQVYVRNKGRQTQEAGMKSFTHRLPADTSEAKLIELVLSLNEAPAVHGILVQLPLPAHIDASRVIAAIDPDKDVDGLHVVNAGRLATGRKGLLPCTPTGCVILARQTLGKLEGREAVIVGRSNLVGKPLAHLMLNENCTVTLAHSRTRHLNEVCRRADILVAAVGVPHLIKGNWVRSGACVIDVGMNRIDTPEGKTRLTGDVDFEEAGKHAAAITPVPGGVGPMTVACLLLNTLKAACQRHELELERYIDLPEAAQGI
ncbi:MAG: bifunctional methylenetetrahydrofolate dehydrogenase/methenyltetrahydrofolate cyclohydrolase FolD [Hyphomicrobiales bacterium]|nr:MAG: bifunctional methylenetetrahydrofolate dehydrogenase/methenyltetrahydrofolate cyclohydrolase FolD [Hyphomicrobiales bacterium]